MKSCPAGGRTTVVSIALIVFLNAIADQRWAALADSGNDFLGRLGFQLFTSRDFPPLDQQLRTISESGYDFVEFNVSTVTNPHRMKAMLDRYGLTSVSGHFDLDALRHNLSNTIQRARIFGIRMVIVPYLSPQARPDD